MDIATVSEALENLSGNTFIGLTTVTTPKLLGGMNNSMQGQITKRVVSVVQIFTNQNTNAYANKRNRNRDKAGEAADFTLSPRAWGERIPNTAFVSHKGKIYLEVIFVKVVSSEYLFDGSPIAKEKVEGLPKARAASETDDVILRTYAVESIKELRAYGNEFTA